MKKRKRRMAAALLLLAAVTIGAAEAAAAQPAGLDFFWLTKQPIGCIRSGYCDAEEAVLLVLPDGGAVSGAAQLKAERYPAGPSQVWPGLYDFDDFILDEKGNRQDKQGGLLALEANQPCRLEEGFWYRFTVWQDGRRQTLTAVCASTARAAEEYQKENLPEGEQTELALSWAETPLRGFGLELIGFSQQPVGWTETPGGQALALLEGTVISVPEGYYLELNAGDGSFSRGQFVMGREPCQASVRTPGGERLETVRLVSEESARRQGEISRLADWIRRAASLLPVRGR